MSRHFSLFQLFEVTVVAAITLAIDRIVLWSMHLRDSIPAILVTCGVLTSVYLTIRWFQPAKTRRRIIFSVLVAGLATFLNGLLVHGVRDWELRRSGGKELFPMQQFQATELLILIETAAAALLSLALIWFAGRVSQTRKLNVSHPPV